MSNYHDSNKRIAKNTAFLYVRMLFVLLVNLYVSRVLLDALGVTDYGIYVVVTGFVTLFGFVNATLASTMQRYYNYTGTQDAVNGIRNVYMLYSCIDSSRCSAPDGDCRAMVYVSLYCDTCRALRSRTFPFSDISIDLGLDYPPDTIYGLGDSQGENGIFCLGEYH